MTKKKNKLASKKDSVNSTPSQTDRNEQNRSVDSELSHLKQELWAANEEVQSTNEELQSINEELLAKNIEIAASNDFAVNLLETANTIILVLDISANIIVFNKYAEKLTGYTKEDVIGKNWFDLFIPFRHKDDLPKVFAEVLKSMPDVSKYKNSIVLKSGMERLISWSNNIIRDISGNIDGILSIGRDITEQNMAEQALKESQLKLLRSRYGTKMGDFDCNIQTGEVFWSPGM
ncbi:MAG: PAS domain S-box protein, partial [Desulfobacteraceae bacterium]|nr:PAS domain S-box protein [Desulfobacteraceae bacterium]